ncbi:MAG: GntR family transcriptional regulator [Bacteroides sp.]|nr:GntR family transcriptional regulator [Roseburia sp.]MCM1346841.1 GntR family transcriptional regulator [Bacteroides sp.]MCM1420633.1 GntR family transcriptional regulator [Bacteroides sp.]
MDFKEKKAIYLQIAEMLCDEILLGKYKEEERIPSVREYATTVEVNANTVVRTYEWLQMQEIIFTKRGLGYFVAHGARETIATMRRKEFLNESLPEVFRTMRTLGISMEEVTERFNKYEVGQEKEDSL